MGDRRNQGRTTVERRSELEFVVTRLFDAPVDLVFEAWSKAEPFQQWWAPKSSPVPLLSCEMDVRTGGGYRLTFGQDAENTMSFFGKYIEVVPLSRIVWTNEESGEGAVTTVTFEDTGAGQTRVVLSELYPSKEALDEAYVGMEDALPEQFEQLDELLLALKDRA
jgi:uncharacterized protein YndB with AHSA1/START domain